MQVLIHLPPELALRFRRSVPTRSRSGYVRGLLEKSLPNADELMYQAALEAQAFDDTQPDEKLIYGAADMDGLDPDETFDLEKLGKLCPA